MSCLRIGNGVVMLRAIESIELDEDGSDQVIIRTISGARHVLEFDGAKVDRAKVVSSIAIRVAAADEVEYTFLSL